MWPSSHNARPVVGVACRTRRSIYLKLSKLDGQGVHFGQSGCRRQVRVEALRAEIEIDPGVRGSRLRSRSGGNPYLMLRLSPLRLRASQMSARRVGASGKRRSRQRAGTSQARWQIRGSPALQGWNADARYNRKTPRRRRSPPHSRLAGRHRRSQPQSVVPVQLVPGARLGPKV